MSNRKRPLLIVVSAPSGAGKSTLCDAILSENDDIVYSVSCTTRDPRGAEVDGEDYYFMTPEGFDRKAKDGCFLEHATVHGHRYGTLLDTVRQAMAEGQSVLMDIDVQGARQIRSYVEETAAEGDPIREGFVDIFVRVPSLVVLEERLRGRAEDSEETIRRRLVNAGEEMKCMDEYRYVIVNDDLERALNQFRAILEKEQDG